MKANVLDLFTNGNFFFIDNFSYGLAKTYGNIEQCGSFIIEVKLVRQISNRKCTVFVSKYNKKFTLVLDANSAHFYCSGNYEPQMSVNIKDIFHANNSEEALRIGRDELGYSELIR